MKLLPNSGKQRVIDELVACAGTTPRLDLATSGFSLFAFAEIRSLLADLTTARLLLSVSEGLPFDLVGGPEERPQRNRLLARHFARICTKWVDQKTEVRFTPFPLPQSAFIPFSSDDTPQKAIIGQCPLTLQGLGLAPSPPLGLIQSTDEPAEASMFAAWFQTAWTSLHAPGKSKDTFLGYLGSMIAATKSAHEQVRYDSDTEREFAENLEKNEAVKIFAKLPGWFMIPTPLGTYNPDWAIVVEIDGEDRLYFVVETKSGMFTDDVRTREDHKIKCGVAHFDELGKSHKNPARFRKSTQKMEFLQP